MKKELVILGGNKLHMGFEKIKVNLGIDKVLVIDWNETPAFSGDKHFQTDIKDFQSITNLDIKWDNVDFVYTSADIAVKTQCELHKKMGLLYPSEEAIENALIKNRSSECWKKAGILNKYSVIVDGYEDVEEWEFEKYIFKPNCASGSRNITILEGKNLNESNIKKAIDHAKKASMDNKCIVEEFVEGIEYTVEMLGDNFGNVGVFGISKKYHTPHNKSNKIATKLHYVPSDISDELLEKIAVFGQACYKALSLKNSLGHLEVIVAKDGRIVPVEMGARSSGYIATHLVDFVSEQSFLKKYRDVLRGEKVKNGINFSRRMSSMYYFYDIYPGISKCSTNIMKYLPKEIETVAWDRDNLVSGKEFAVICADHERYGFEIIGGPREILTITEIENAERKFNQDFVGMEG